MLMMQFKKNIYLFSLSVSLFLLSGCFSAVLAFDSEPLFVKVFDPAKKADPKWKNDDDQTHLSLRSFKGTGVLENERTEKSWGAMAKNISIDLDRFPALQIQVLSSEKKWYLIVAGPQIPQGYIRLKETDEKGLFEFNVAQLTGLKGKQKFTVKLGISNPDARKLSDEKLFFDKLVFLSDANENRKGKKLEKEKKRSKKGDEVDLIGAGKESWLESRDDGIPEVRLSVGGEGFVLKGKLENRNWGAARRKCAVDLNRYPVLEINVTDSSKSWYLILTASYLPGGYQRLIETDKKGNFVFDIPKLTAQSGEKTFDLELGVSDPQGSSIEEEWMSFDCLRFRK